MSTITSPLTRTTPTAVRAPTDRRDARIAAACLGLGAVLANAAFVGLGSVFDYPDVLLRPTDEILVAFRANRPTVIAWFAVLAVGAALLGPGAVHLARLGRGRAARWSAGVGVAAAAVQVIGLSRWFLVVPGLAARIADPATTPAGADAATTRFELAHTVLGKVAGETAGYTLTALWTVLVVVGLGHLVGGRPSRIAGLLAAALVLSGVLTPLGVPGTELANFVGYILWSLWIVVLSARLLWRSRGVTVPG